MSPDGWTNVSNVPSTSPPRDLIAPISTISPSFHDPDVVSRSTAQNVTSRSGISISSKIPASERWREIARGRAATGCIASGHRRPRDRQLPNVCSSQGLTAKSAQRPGTPLSSCSPRSSKPSPEPVTRSATVRDTQPRRASPRTSRVRRCARRSRRCRRRRSRSRPYACRPGCRCPRPDADRMSRRASDGIGRHRRTWRGTRRPPSRCWRPPKRSISSLHDLVVRRRGSRASDGRRSCCAARSTTRRPRRGRWRACA